MNDKAKNPAKVETKVPDVHLSVEEARKAIERLEELVRRRILAAIRAQRNM